MRYFSNAAGCCVKPLLPSCCFTLETSTMQKPRVFEAFQANTSQRTPKIIKTKRRNTWYLQQFRKNVTKKQDKQLWKKYPKHRLVETTQNLGFSSFWPKNLPKINDTPRAAADARATLLLLLAQTKTAARNCCYLKQLGMLPATA